MKTKDEEFEVLVPDVEGTGIAERVRITVPLKWDEELEEWLLTPESHELIESTKARHMGLLLPAQLKELRERYDFSQKEMGELFQVGQKSWTRWESGRHRPSRSINLLIRALYEGKLSVNYLLKRAGKPPRLDTTWVQKAFHVFSGPGQLSPGASPKPAPDIVCYGRGADQVVVVQYKSSPEEQSPFGQFHNLLVHQQEALKLVPETTKSTRLIARRAPTHTYPRPSLLPTES